ncbi:MAG: response regulator [Lachnospiraceae bacterium]|nr:response regulator [Lachnospiraceae bacterium]
MKEKTAKQQNNQTDRKAGLLLSIILIFCIFGVIVFFVSRRISNEMSSSAIQNLNENLDLIKCTIESMIIKDADYQKLMAKDLATRDNYEAIIRNYRKNHTMVKISMIPAGETTGISSSGEVFSEGDMEFTPSEMIEGIEISQSYLNYMGTWAYTLKCPIEDGHREIGSLYVEYTFDTIDKLLPEGFYNKQAMLYVMDTKTERFVLKPKGMGERNAGHLNLQDFYRANNIHEKAFRSQIEQCLQNKENMMFYHNIRGNSALNFIWMTNDGTICLTGYVPTDAIQQEGKSVTYNICIVVLAMLTAFFLCCLLYYVNQRQQRRLMWERAAEREQHNRQLKEALHAAQLASNAKTTFLSNMSHDIRTPMNAVLGFTTLLSKDAGNVEKVREYTKKIKASGQHLISLINDILEVSKIESGKVVLTEEEFALNDLVSSLDAIIRPMAAAKAQNFHVEVTNLQHEYLRGDETRINQILINLLSNAVKYTQEGGNIWFRMIGLKQSSQNYERIRIEVEDDGYGMTQEYLKTIFDVFTRAENSTTNKVQGTGLGMAITKNIVELMGGTIEVFSEVDKGSLFRVEMELRISESQADRRFWEQSGILRILSVDRNVQEIHNIQTIMEDMGISLDLALEAEDALRRIETASRTREQYQMVLLDWDTLETAGGVRMAEKIRKTMPESAFLLFMSDNDTDDMEEMLRFGYTGALLKPVFVSALKEKVIEIQAEESGAVSSEAESEHSLQGLHFLAAEDNEINAEILCEILSSEGADCEITENGQLAVERFKASAEGEFDAILMDVQMPVMNGYDATRAIRALPRADAAAIPIFAMTANAFAEDEKDALNAGMNVHLAKPVDVALLKKVIHQYVHKNQ